MSESVAKARISPGSRRRIVDIPRLPSRPVPARDAFATDSDTLPPDPVPGAPPAPTHPYSGPTDPNNKRQHRHRQGVAPNCRSSAAGKGGSRIPLTPRPGAAGRRNGAMTPIPNRPAPWRTLKSMREPPFPALGRSRPLPWTRTRPATAPHGIRPAPTVSLIRTNGGGQAGPGA